MSLTKSPTPTRGPSLLLRLTLLCVAVAAISYAADQLVHQLPPTNGPRQQVVNAVTTYAPTVMSVAGAGAGGLVALMLLIGVLRRRGGPTARRAPSGRNHDIVQALAHHLKVPPDLITRCTAKRAGGRVVSGSAQLARRTPLVVDTTEAATRALAPIAASPHLAVTTSPTRWGTTTIHWAPAPPPTTSWWQQHPQLVRLHEEVGQLLGGLDIDRAGTVLEEDGTPSKVVFTYDTTTKAASDNFRARVRTVLQANAPSPTGAWNFIWLPHRRQLVLTPGVPLPEKLPIEPPPADLPPHTMPLGRRIGGHVALWRPSQFPHLLVAGATGGGKSSLIRTLLLLAVLLKWDVYVADPKRVGYRMFAKWLGIPQSRIATDGETIEAMVLAVAAETKRRYRLCEWGGARPSDFRPVLLIMDENTEAIAVMNEWARRVWADEHPDKPVPKGVRSDGVAALWYIGRMGREGGVYCCYAHQRPDVTYIPGEARDNMVSRYAAGHLRPKGLGMLFDDETIEQRVTMPVVDDETGEIREEAVKGRGTVDLGGGPEPLQGYWTPKIWDDQDCPPDGADAAAMNALLPAIRATWATATAEGLTLLPGLLEIQYGGRVIGPVGGIPASELVPDTTSYLYDEDSNDEDADDSEAVDTTTNPSPPPANGRNGRTGAPPATSPPPDDGGDGGPTGMSGDDWELLRQAAELVVVSQHGSTAMLQRKLRVGHPRAVELMNQLRAAGVVGPHTGPKAREVLLAPGTDLDQFLATSAGTRPADTLVAVTALVSDDRIVLDLDDGPVEVMVEALCDSVDDDCVELEYRVTQDGHPRHGQQATVALDSSTLVRRLTV